MHVRTIVTAVLASISCSAAAQAFPTKPLRMVVAFTAGSAIDVLARVVAQRLGEQWGQQVIVENRPGAGGSLGSNSVAKAPPDGYTLLVHTNAYATNVALHANLPYDPHADLRPVSPLGTQPYLLVVNPAAGAKTSVEFMVKARAKAGGVTYGSAGTGSGTHFVAEKFRLAAGLHGTHIPYKGGPEATADVVAGRIDYWLPPISIAVSAVRDGKLVALAVTSGSRSNLLPDVPTLAEGGLAGFDASFWSGVWVPAKTPDGIVKRLSSEIASALDSPGVRERMSKMGVEPLKLSPDEFARFIRREMDDAAEIVKSAGIRAE
jgi:tripartite-type tricarboxylate transporter receptor subunit TctC